MSARKPIEPDEVLNKSSNKQGMTDGSKSTQFGNRPQPAQSGGLTREGAFLRNQLREQAIKGASPILDRLRELALKSDDDEVSRKACCDYLSYAIGKPTAMVEVDPGDGNVAEVRSITVTVVRHGDDE